MSNPLGIKGIDHIEFYVDDADAWSDFYCEKFGMTPKAVKGGGQFRHDDGLYSIVVGQGRVVFVFTQADCRDGQTPTPQGSRVAEHVAKHGCGVKNVAFKVVDAYKAFEEAKSRGAESAGADHQRTAIKAYGDTIHSFEQRTAGSLFGSGFVDCLSSIEYSDTSFQMIDHVVANVENMNEWVDYYSVIFGFEQTAHFDINTGRSALMSKVMGERDGYIKLPINEPSSANSQIQEFLDEYKGPGVQHIALLTPDIISSVAEMRTNGVSFMDVPDTYYDEAFLARVGEIKENVDVLKENKVLVDRDRPDGYLLQLFTHPIFGRPTLFHEVIQRRGNSAGFGEGNFKALFEAIEREQAKRGTL